MIPRFQILNSNSNIILNSRFQIPNSIRGIPALPTILIISGIVAEIAITGVLISYLLSSSGFGARLSAEAWAAARAGVNDAVIKVARDKNFTTGGGDYTISVGNNTATIVVDEPSSGKKRIRSTGAAKIFSKKIEAIYSIDTTTGKLIMESYGEIPL